MKNLRRKGRIALRVIAIVLIALVILSIYMYMEARLVRVCYAQLYLDDLPPSFDGKKILFVSDVHLDRFNSPERAATLINDLQYLYPDMLLLGGDYTAVDLVGALSTGANTALQLTEQQNARQRFFSLISNFYAPLGKYSVAGNHDDGITGLREAMAAGGVSLLDNQYVTIQSDGASIILMGLADWWTGEQLTSDALLGFAGQCVMLLSHNPAAFDAMCFADDSGKAPFDVMFSGHTHGGQVNLPIVRDILRARIGHPKYLSGWHKKDDAHLLVTNGIGASALPFRLGAPPQVHLITLRVR